MSESFQSALEKVNFGKYVDQVEQELKRALDEVGPGRTPGEIEATQVRLQELVRRQYKELAREVGISGSHVLVFMMATAIISAAWLSFALRREATNLSKSPEDRLAVIDVLDALDLAFSKVIAAGSAHADRMPAAGAGTAASEARTGTGSS
jgi:hypothetical protein